IVGDPSGIVFQLQDVSYCGGSGPLGNVCQAQPSPAKGLIAVKDMSHFTINARDPGTAKFYQDVFGFGVRAMQATTPGYAVGPGVHFLMFAGGGGGARGGAPGAAAPELYFSDPDGLSIQLQDTKYCGGGGYLGDVCLT